MQLATIFCFLKPKMRRPLHIFLVLTIAIILLVNIVTPLMGLVDGRLSVATSSPSRSCSFFREQNLTGPINASLAEEIITDMVTFQATSGKCPLFMDRYTHPLMFWKPAVGSSRYRLPPGTCRKPQNANGACDYMFNAHMNAAATEYIYKHQHPADCAKVNFLVLTRQWRGGLGSTVHMNAFMLLRAMQYNRVLIEAPNIAWEMTNPNSCAGRNWSCYFAPVTNCTLPKDWQQHAKHVVQSQTNLFANQSLQYIAVHVFPPSNEYNFEQSTFLNGSHLPEGWWFTHTTAYMLRPAPRTVRAACHAWTCIHGAKAVPRPMAAVFIRRGDKWKEAKPHNLTDYAEAMTNIHKQSPIRTIYVGTDDATTLIQARQIFEGYNVFWLGYHRDVGGLTHEEVQSRYHSAKAEWQVLLSLIDLLFTISADVMVGTLSSNWCRLANEWRRVHGNLLAPYFSIDDMDVGP